jgi:hypothetical protein
MLFVAVGSRAVGGCVWRWMVWLIANAMGVGILGMGIVEGED